MNKKRYLLIISIVAVAALFLVSSCETFSSWRFGTVNYRPVINSLEAEAYWIDPSVSIQVTCRASDRDGDMLSYEWITTGGNITGTGSEVIWTAPSRSWHV